MTRPPEAEILEIMECLTETYGVSEIAGRLKVPASSWRHAINRTQGISRSIIFALFDLGTGALRPHVLDLLDPPTERQPDGTGPEAPPAEAPDTASEETVPPVAEPVTMSIKAEEPYFAEMAKRIYRLAAGTPPSSLPEAFIETARRRADRAQHLEVKVDRAIVATVGNAMVKDSPDEEGHAMLMVGGRIGLTALHLQDATALWAALDAYLTEKGL